MAWVKVPPEHHPLFLAALPADSGVETKRMFGGVVAQINGHSFAALFGRSVAVTLPEPARGEALALNGASYFDPMGDGRRRSDKIMLPETMMRQPQELRAWVARAFAAAAQLPAKTKPARKSRR
jgi:TfoX/Sxy family transcriptional regulator of competence genes